MYRKLYKCQGIPSANQPADCRFYGGMDSAPVAQDGCERLHLGDDRCRVSSESSYPAGLLTKVDFPEPFSPIRAMSWWHLVTLQIPSGKRWHNYGKSPCYQWVNPLFLWQFSIAMLNDHRVHIFEGRMGKDRSDPAAWSMMTWERMDACDLKGSALINFADLL